MMLNFVLRFLIMLGIGLAISASIVDRSIDYLFKSASHAYVRESIRGQVHSLTHELARVAPTQRNDYIDTQLAPHYGLQLRIVESQFLNPSDEEQDHIATGHFLIRDNRQTVVAAIPGDATQWLELRLPPDPAIDPWVVIAVYGALGGLLSSFMLMWVLPVWRGLGALKTATQRMGQGDLQARVQLSPLSSMASLGATFNQMSERIHGLITQQRDLSNTVSHELRTPIARLSFELEMIEQEHSPAKKKQLIVEMKNDVTELNNMASELLMYARLEQKNNNLTLQAQAARRWLDNIVQHLSIEAGGRGVSLEIVCCDVKDVYLHPRYMDRALLNLLQNAIRYAQIHIQISLYASTTGGYVLTVDDDGPGIAQSDREKVFEPFTRLDESRDRGTGGAGLGLAIVKRVAQWHDGSIKISDSPLGGARFMLSWQAA